MKILAVIVTYNGRPWLDRCLGSVAGADLYVWDNASADGSADYVAAHFPAAVLHRSPENVGFAAANNAGFRYALEHGYDAVYLLNQDAWLTPGALPVLSTALSAHPDFALLSPLQLRACGTALPLILPQALDPLFAKNVWAKSGEECDGIREVGRVMAAHWLVSCAALRKVGRFCEELPLYGQDDNWCDRALYHGFRIGVVPAAKAVHDRSFRQEAKEKIIYRNYYMGSLVRLLDVRRPLAGRWAFVWLFTLVKSVKYGSWKPWKYLFNNLLPQRKTVRRLRRQYRTPLCPN